MTSVDLDVFRRDDKTYNLAFTDADGAAIDLTGATIFFTVKTNETDIDDDALIKVEQSSHSNATGGLTTISVTNSQTDIAPGSFFYDFQYVTSGGIVTTVLSGRYNILQDISIRVA